MFQKITYRTTMPFQGGLSPTTPKSTAVPLFGDTPSLQDLSSGSTMKNDLHGRGSWGNGEDIDHSYRSEGDDYRRDDKVNSILKKLTGRPRKKRERWILESVSGQDMEFDDYKEMQTYIRKNSLPFNRIRMRIAQQNRMDVVSKAIASSVMIQSSVIGSNSMEIGAGFHIGDGLYVTCAHVIQRYNKYEKSSGEIGDNNLRIVLIRDDLEVSGTLLASDFALDLAVVKSDMPSETLDLEGKSTPSGIDVFAVGSPRGYENNVSSGIVSGNDRPVFDYPNAPLFTFTDANVLPGNSGGPLVLYDKGTVIGMLSLIVGAEGLYGLNAALPASYILRFLKDKKIR